MLDNNSGGSIDAFFERTCQLETPYQVADIQAILTDAVHSGLSEAELCELGYKITKKTKLSSQAVQKAAKLALDTHPKYGLLREPSDFAKALTDELESMTSMLAWVGSNLYVYFTAQDNEDSNEPVGSEGYFSRISLEDLDQYLLDEFAAAALVQRKNSRKEIIEQVSKRLRDNDFFCDAVPGLCALNGFVRWTEAGGLQLEEHKAEHKARVKLDFNFSAEASYEWLEQKLLATLGDASKAAALQEFVGSILFDVHPEKDEARRVCLLVGPQNSGKSTILSIMEALLPPESVASVSPDDWGQESHRAKLEGVTLNLAYELGSDMRVPAAQLKKIASLEPVTARHLYGNPFSFRPTARHMFATNELPRITDKSNASARRILCIMYDRSLNADEIDPSFVDKVLDDPNSFIHWAAAGARRLALQQRFTLPEGHERAASDMQHGEDVAAILAHTKIEAGREERLTSLQLQASLRSLSEELGLSPDRVNDGTMRKLSKLLNSLYGAERHQSSGRPFYQGVRFRPGCGYPTPTESAPRRVDPRTRQLALDDL